VDRRGLERFGRFTGALVLDSGEPFELRDFQRWALGPYFAGAIETVVSTPKGQGKSTLLGALGLYALLSVDEADIPICAASRDQASVLLAQAQAFVRRSPALAKRLRVTRREVHCPGRSGVLRVISADANTGDGLIPYPAVFCDELHRWRSADLFETLGTALAKRGAQRVTISTAGIREESPLWPIREGALALNVHRDGVRLSGDSDDGSFALRELSAPDDADWRDLDIAQAVNPLVDRATLARRLASPAQNERSWRRFTMNTWLEAAADDAVISADTWRDLVDESEAPMDGTVAFAVDVSLERDLASIAVAGHVGGKVLVQVVDSGMGVAWVPKRLAELTEAHKCLPVAVDGVGPSGALVPRIEEWGCETRVTSTREFAAASATFLDLIGEDRLRHRNDAPLNLAVQGAVMRPLGDSRAWSRRKSLNDSSPLVAASLAVWALTTLGPISREAFEYGMGTPEDDD
jgi:phage terminase large subunit-like protein